MLAAIIYLSSKKYENKQDIILFGQIVISNAMSRLTNVKPQNSNEFHSPSRIFSFILMLYGYGTISLNTKNSVN